MEPSQKSSHTEEPVQKKARVEHRVWTWQEEDALINALKDLVVEGWRVGAKFKTGYLQRLEAALLAEFPSSGITGDQHILSKVTEWEKVHEQILDMQENWGFNWLWSDKMLEGEDDMWDDYLKVHPDAETMRDESFPYFDDWNKIFWNDQATGEFAEDCGSIALDIENRGNSKGHTKTKEKGKKRKFSN